MHGVVQPAGAVTARLMWRVEMKQKRQVLFVRLAPFLKARTPHPRDILWPVSALYTAGILRRRGMESRILDTWQRVRPVHALGAHIARLDPTHLFLETRTPTVDLTLDLASRLRRILPNVEIWAIGQHASEKPEDFLSEGTPFRGCVRGEIEPVVPRIVSGEEAVPGTSTWNDGIRHHGPVAELDDLDSLPMLDPSGLELDRYHMLSVHVPSFRRHRWGYLLTSRGCGYRCIFCSPTLRQSYGKRFRAQSPERVAEEMARLHANHGITAFYALDDLFTGDTDRVHAICDAILARGLRVKWTIQTRMDHLDRPLLVHLREAGCVGIKVGIESGNQRVSEILAKHLDNEKVLAMAREMDRLGINLTACYMVGNPTERLEEMEDTVRFAHQVGALMIQVAYHTPYPGSESYRRYASSQEFDGRSHFDGIPANLSAVPDETLIRFHRNFYLRYYLSPAQILRYVRRRAVYKLFRADELRLLIRTTGYLAHEGVKRKLGLSDAHPLET